MAEPIRPPSSDMPKRRKPVRKRSIARHPLFPVIAALWFGVLLGFGSFALRTSLIEQLVLSLHIDAIVPAAAPPLGMTARLGLALLLGLAGGAIGFLFARRIGHPGEKPAQHVFQVADVDLDAPFVAPVKVEAPADRLAELIADAISAPVPAAEPTAGHEGPVLMIPAPAPEPESPPEPAPVIIDQPASPPVPTAAERIADADLAELSHVELVERLAIALQRRQARQESEAQEAAEAPNPVVQFPDLAERRSPRESASVTPLRPAPQETERALRDALAALQRMSGTA